MKEAYLSQTACLSVILLKLKTSNGFKEQCSFQATVLVYFGLAKTLHCCTTLSANRKGYTHLLN